jgi:hypothetical protein
LLLFQLTKEFRQWCTMFVVLRRSRRVARLHGIGLGHAGSSGHAINELIYVSFNVFRLAEDKS